MTTSYDMQNNSDNKTNISRKSKKKILVIAVAVILVLLIPVTTFMLWPANISRSDAQEIAIAHVGGSRANRPSRDFERFQRVWSVEVFYEGFVHEVYVSMRTGEVVRVEIDRWD